VLTTALSGEAEAVSSSAANCVRESVASSTSGLPLMTVWSSNAASLSRVVFGTDVAATTATDRPMPLSRAVRVLPSGAGWFTAGQASEVWPTDSSSSALSDAAPTSGAAASSGTGGGGSIGADGALCKPAAKSGCGGWPRVLLRRAGCCI